MSRSSKIRASEQKNNHDAHGPSRSPRGKRRRSAAVTEAAALHVIEMLERRVLLTAAPAGNYNGTFATNTEFLDTSAPYIINGPLTVATGVTLTVGANVKVQINSGQALTVSGAMSLASGSTLTLQANNTTQLIINGTLTATGATITQSYSNGWPTPLTVNAGGHLVASNSTFSNSQLTLSAGSVFNGGDLVNDSFNLPLCRMIFMALTSGTPLRCIRVQSVFRVPA